LDRIDIQVGVSAVPVKDLDSLSSGESSSVIRERVLKAREMQKLRYRGIHGVFSNADAKSRDLKEVCKLTNEAAGEIRRTIEALSLSARAYDRILRVARTIADLAGEECVNREAILEAASYRQLDSEDGESFWA
jgi:magnesium chelatase family protein